jgi:hypothetical protein
MSAVNHAKGEIEDCPPLFKAKTEMGKAKTTKQKQTIVHIFSQFISWSDVLLHFVILLLQNLVHKIIMTSLSGQYPAKIHCQVQVLNKKGNIFLLVTWA